MICPYCGADNDKVIDSRAADAGKSVRRRRECVACSRRFTTYERLDQSARLVVVKRDGTRAPFDRDNVLRGLRAACGKRPIPEDVKERLADQVEEELQREFDREVESRVIGERVMRRLRDIDEVAYIRFASEYHKFRSLEDVMEQLQELNGRIRDAKDQQKLF